MNYEKIKIPEGISFNYPFIMGHMFPEDVHPCKEDRGDYIAGHIESLIHNIGGTSFMTSTDKPDICNFGAYGTILDIDKAFDVCVSGVFSIEQLEKAKNWYEGITYLSFIFGLMTIVCSKAIDELKERENK